MESQPSATLNAPTRVETSTSAPAPATASSSQKHRKAPLIVASIMSILAIAGISFGIYFLIDSQNKASQNAELATKINLLEQATGATLTETPSANGSNAIEVSQDVFREKDSEVKEVVQALYDAVTDQIAPFNKVYNTSYPLFYVEEANTMLPLDKSYGLGPSYSYGALASTDSSKLNDYSATLSRKLTDLGFTRYERLADAPFYITGGETMIRADGIVCVVGSGIPALTGCGYSQWLSETTINLAKELSSAFYEVKGNYPATLNVKSPVIKDSPVAPYQTLQVSMENAAGLFFRTSPNSKWQFFAATQAELSCNDYNTTDLKNAFAGEPCWDEQAGRTRAVEP